MRGLFLILVLAVAYSCADYRKMTPEAMACHGLLKPIRSDEANRAALDKCIAAQPGLQATIDQLMAAASANASLPSAGAKLANASLPSAGATAVNTSLPSTGATAVNVSAPLAGAKVANAALPSAGAKAANASLPSSVGAILANASLPSSAGANFTKSRSDYKGECKGNPVSLLKAAGKTADVTTLNKCLAKENGHLVMATDGKSSSFDVAKFKGEIKAKVAGTSSQFNTQLGLDKCPEADLVAFEVYKYMKCVKAYCTTGAAPTNKA